MKLIQKQIMTILKIENIMRKMSEIIDNQVIENLGDFSQDILFDSQLFKKIKKADYNITEYSGFNRKLWEKFGLRKNIMYYGLSLTEKALNIEVTSNKIEIPLLEKRELIQRISKINEKNRCKIGWIYIGSIQMIISATFREGIDTPIDLALLDNRIVNKKEAILGIIRGNPPPPSSSGCAGHSTEIPAVTSNNWKLL